LQSHLCSLYALQPENTIIKYEDDQNELITMSSAEELLEALRIIDGKNLLKIVISEKQDKVDISRFNNHNHQHNGRRQGKCRGEKRKRNHYDRITIPDDKLKLLEEFGFVDKRENIRAWKKCYREENDFSKVIDFLCEKNKKIQDRKQKRKEREEKKHLKDLDHAEKDKKMDKYVAKKARIEEKIKRKEVRRSRKRAKTSLGRSFADPYATTTWEDIADIYIDGESLLHTCQALRQLIYKKKDRKKAEDLIVMIAKDYAKSSRLNTILVFKEKPEWIHAEVEDMKDDESKFRIVFANPSHQTPGDFMVAVSTNRIDDAEVLVAKKYVFVSNSLELADLIQSGVKVLNPRKFMAYAANILGKDKQISTCAWLIEKLGAEISAEKSVDAIGDQVQKVSILDDNPID